MHGMLMWIGRVTRAARRGSVRRGPSPQRLAGSYQLGSFQALTLLDAGTAAMVMGCLAYIASLAEGRAHP